MFLFNMKLHIIFLICLNSVLCFSASNNFKVVLTRYNFEQFQSNHQNRSEYHENGEVYLQQTSKENIFMKLEKNEEKFYFKLDRSNLHRLERFEEEPCFHGRGLIYRKMKTFQRLRNSWAALTVCKNFVEGFLLIESQGFLMETEKVDLFDKYKNIRRETREVNLEHSSNIGQRENVSSKSFFNLTGDTLFDCSSLGDGDNGESVVEAANYEVAPVRSRNGNRSEGGQKLGVSNEHDLGVIDSEEYISDLEIGDRSRGRRTNNSENFGRSKNEKRLDYENWLMEQSDEELGYFYDSAWKSVVTKNRNHNRFQNPHRFLEIIIAVDESVIRFHGRVRVKQYVLTLLNIVNALYQDPSLEANLQIVIREMHLYEKKRNVIRLGNAKKSLENVNLWNRDLHQIYGDDDEPHDIALWLTRTDIGGPSGYAPVGGVCDPERSCALTRDEGLTCAFIIAHELAHILGLSHDGDAKNNNTCRDESLHGSVMAPMVSATFHHFLWSECSRREFSAKVSVYSFLGDSKWQCLLNVPDARRSIELNTTLGARFSMDEQCRVEFGDGYELCRSFDIVEPCAHLWCSHVKSPLVCKTKKGPPLEGTECGPHKWCVDGYCDSTLRLNLDPLKYNPQDGGWTKWGTWTPCSRSCGLGMQFRSRACDNPRPAYGGRDCDGLHEEWQICNTRECPDTRDFRAQQCGRMLQLLDVPKNLTWLPYESHQQDLKCNYICQSKETGEIYASEEFLTDGTPCSYDWDNKRCVQGKCVTIGCDNVVNSTLIKDGCGVCNGNNSQCIRIKSHINKKIKKQITRLGVLHNQARHIAIKFTLNQDTPIGTRVSDGNNGSVVQIDFDLFLKDRKRNAFFIRKSPFVGEFNRPYNYVRPNPHHQPSVHPNDVPLEDQDFPPEPSPEEHYGISITIVHGAKFRFHALETDNPLLPLNESLFLSTQGPLLKEMVLFIEIKNYRQHRGLKLNMVMEYLLHRKFKETRYEWIVGGWGSCSVSCGGGKRFKTKACVEKATQKLVARKFCSIVNKPPTDVQICNNFSCNFVWLPGIWEPCSATCGTTGMQHREIYCIPQNLLNSSLNSLELQETAWKYMLPPNKCGYQPPTTSRACNRTTCPGHWEYTPWSECSTTCRSGQQYRTAECIRDARTDVEATRPDDNEVACEILQNDAVKIQTQYCESENEARSSCEGDTSPFCELESSLRYCLIESFKELCYYSCSQYSKLI